MPHDPARVEDTRSWLRKANVDLIAAEFELGHPLLLSDVAFHAQQAVEKALKAFLAWHDQPLPKSHDLERIGRACARIDSDLEKSVDQAVPLTEYAWAFRYPGPKDEPTLEEAKQALRIARQVYEAVLSKLSHVVSVA
jgi:HEPN domain-containing protein